VYGGGERRKQAFQLGLGVDVVIATPGRLIDFMESGTIDLGRVSFMVLDEADRMLGKLGE
jgi:superfamily II DNA/RNA helicase